MAEEAAHAAKEAAALAEKEAEGKSPEAHQG